MTRTVLLTGFGPFPGVPTNASGELARRLCRVAARRFPTVRFEQATLPTEWSIAPRLLEDLLVRLRPDVAIHFGVSHMAEGFVVETSAWNRAANVDAGGFEPISDQLYPDKPAERLTTLPAARIVQRLRRLGLPAYLSHDAGAYLCNAVYYHSLQFNDEVHPAGQSAFIHLPSGLAQCSQPLSPSAALAGGLEIVATVLKQPPASRFPSSVLTA